MVLTRLPAGRIDGDGPPIGHAAWAFPVVGACVGAIAGLVFHAADMLGLPRMVAALLAMFCLVLLTGALHEDGLADVADGFGGGHTRARKLEIMRDSRLGSYGAVALVLVLGLIATSSAEAGTWLGFVAIGTISRAAMVLPMTLLPPARHDGLGQGAATPFDERAIAAVILTLPCAVLVPMAALAALVVTLAVMWLAKRQIGGQTGDVLGATQKLAECAGWIVIAAAA